MTGKSQAARQPAKLTAKRVRWHEASHVVIARVLGFTVLEVSAREDAKYRGSTTVGPRPEGTEQQFHANEIKVLLAGMLTEAKKFPELDLQNDIMPHKRLGDGLSPRPQTRCHRQAATAEADEHPPRLPGHR